jgi:tetratricopeptide (TPR) repeat protein
MTLALAIALALPLAAAPPAEKAKAQPAGKVAPPPAARPNGRAVTDAAERLADEAMALVPRDPAGAVERARKAVAATAEFEPTVYVAMGRKGEVVEDEFQAARDGFRQHRARVYEALGRGLAAQGQPLPASRYLRRAFLLDPTPARGVALAGTLNDLGRGREALDTVQRAIGGLVGLKPDAAQAISRAADVAGLPSAQAEIDRGRLKAQMGDKVTLRDGPLELPPGAHLSNAPTFRVDDAPLTIVYAAEASCRSCSADLDEIARQQLPKDARVVALAASEDQDQALRQVLALYRRPWPLLVGRGVAGDLALPPRSVMLVARSGFTIAVMKAPFGADLGGALAALQRNDVPETVPRPYWNRRPVDRSPLPPPHGLLPEGFAPGEDEPFPPEFTAAVEAYRAGRPQEALAGIEALAAKGDGWLLPPEARLDRALCLAGLGRRDEARRILLRTGDSRFEDAIDKLLEAVAAKP